MSDEAIEEEEEKKWSERLGNTPDGKALAKQLVRVSETLRSNLSLAIIPEDGDDNHGQDDSDEDGHRHSRFSDYDRRWPKILESLDEIQKLVCVPFINHQGSFSFAPNLEAALCDKAYALHRLVRDDDQNDKVNEKIGVAIHSALHALNTSYGQIDEMAKKIRVQL